MLSGCQAVIEHAGLHVESHCTSCHVEIEAGREPGGYQGELPDGTEFDGVCCTVADALRNDNKAMAHPLTC